MGIQNPADKGEASELETEPEDESGELDMDGLSDSEIDGYIKSPDEVKMTTEMWMKLNGEYMKEMEGNWIFLTKSYCYLIII